MLTEGKRGAVFYIHCAISLFLMFFAGRVFEPVGTLTEVGMQVTGVFFGLVWAWCFIGFLWPSLIGLIAFALTDLVTFAQVGTMSFGGGVPILLLFSFILFGSPQHVGATRYITRFFLTRKVFNNRPIVFSFVFFFATYALSVAVNVTPALVLMWSVLYGVLNELGYKKGEKFTSLMLVGTFLGAISGQASLPFTGSTLAIIAVFEAQSGLVVPIPNYMLLGFINTVIVMAIYCLYMKLVLKTEELTKVAHVNTEMFERDPLPPMSALQKANFFGMLGFVFLMLLPSFMPNEFILTRILTTLGPGGIAIMLTGLMIVVKVQGQSILDFKAVAAKSINWDVYIMVCVALAVSGAFMNPATGVREMMIEIFRPVLGGHEPGMLATILLLIGTFITNFASSMIIGIIYMPVIVEFGVLAGANITAIASVVILLLHYSIILPSASVFAAMLWSNSEWITPKEVFKIGAVIVAAAIIVAIFIMMPISLVLMPMP